MRQSARFSESSIIYTGTLLAASLTSCGASSATTGIPTWLSPVTAGVISGLLGLAISFYVGWRASRRSMRLREQIQPNYQYNAPLQDQEPLTEGEEVRLVWVVNALEKFGNTVLGGDATGEPKRTIFELRAGLLEAGIWTNDDVATFDRVIQTRNAVVHGDSSSRAEIRRALDDGVRLLERTAAGDRSPRMP
jgi:hypothetical protein